VKLQPDYCGVMDTVSMYTDMLALCMEAAAVNLVNSHLSYALIAGNKAGAESLKKMFDDIASGEPAVAIDRRLFAPDGSPLWQAFNNDIKSNYIVTDLLNDMRTLYNQFDTEIGIPNANVNKRERLITDEVNANNAESVARAALWLQELKESFEKVNNMFGLSLAVDWRNPPEEMVSEAEEAENAE
jgi:pyruvate carboxylase